MGQKQTFEGLVKMSALPPKADMAAAVQNVRYVPIADIPPPFLSHVLNCFPITLGPKEAEQVNF